MKIQLPDTVWSQQDLKALILQIHSYQSWLAQTSVKEHYGGGSAEHPPSVSQTAVNLIKDWGKEQEINQKSLDDLIAALNELEANTPYMSITLAAPPPNGLKKSIIAWCRENIDPN